MQKVITQVEYVNYYKMLTYVKDIDWPRKNT